MGAGGQTWWSDNRPAQWSRDEHHLCLLYLYQTNKAGGQRQTSAWHGSPPTEWQVGPVKAPRHWKTTPGPAAPCPIPLQTPRWEQLAAAAPRRWPYDLIKCNYHQLLVLGGERRGDLLEGNIHFLLFIYFHWLYSYFISEEIIAKKNPVTLSTWSQS